MTKLGFASPLRPNSSTITNASRICRPLRTSSAQYKPEKGRGTWKIKWTKGSMSIVNGSMERRCIGLSSLSSCGKNSCSYVLHKILLPDSITCIQSGASVPRCEIWSISFQIAGILCKYCKTVTFFFFFTLHYIISKDAVLIYNTGCVALSKRYAVCESDVDLTINPAHGWNLSCTPKRYIKPRICLHKSLCENQRAQLCSMQNNKVESVGKLKIRIQPGTALQINRMLRCFSRHYKISRTELEWTGMCNPVVTL